MFGVVGVPVVEVALAAQQEGLHYIGESTPPAAVGDQLQGRCGPAVMVYMHTYEGKISDGMGMGLDRMNDKE